jgi:hypothetical protein
MNTKRTLSPILHFRFHALPTISSPTFFQHTNSEHLQLLHRSFRKSRKGTPCVTNSGPTNELVKFFVNTLVPCFDQFRFFSRHSMTCSFQHMHKVVEQKHLPIVFPHDRAPFLTLHHRPSPETLETAKKSNTISYKNKIQQSRHNRFCPPIFLFPFSLPSLNPFTTHPISSTTRHKRYTSCCEERCHYLHQHTKHKPIDQTAQTVTKP